MKQLLFSLPVFFLIFNACQPNKQLSTDKALNSVYAQNILKDYLITKKQKIKTRYEYNVESHIDTTLMRITNYDSLGRIVQIEEIGDKEFGEIIYSTIYQNNLPSQTTIYGADLYDIVIQFEYNETGQIIKQTESSAEPRIYTFIYNNDGLISEMKGQTTVFVEDSLIWIPAEKYLHKYDEHGNQIETQLLRYDNQIDIIFKSRYNNKNQLIEMIDSSDENEIIYQSYFQYKNELLIKEENIIDGSITVYQYEFYD